MWLTPAERRGALALVVILLLGTAWDLWRSSRWAIRPAGHFARLSDAPDSSARSPGSWLRASDLRDSVRPTLDLNRATGRAGRTAGTERWQVVSSSTVSERADT